jgi:hypothetical protein
MQTSERDIGPSYFHDASVEAGGQTFRLSADEARIHQTGAYDWHGAGDPASWLTVAIFKEARRRTGDAGNEVAFALAAMSLGITTEQLRSSIEWHENHTKG